MSDLPYRIIIGLEVHVQLLTRTKLFCGCATKFGLPPNSATCPVCLGMPGVLPVMNRRAFELALKAALALNCRIASFTKWDRKNYYYPDLPKNYQISQYDLPLSKDGWLEIPAGAGLSPPQGGPSAPAPQPQGERGIRRIGIIRVHLEEDAGKLLHDESGGASDSRVDLNRTGTPLLEIVSQPDLRTPAEAKSYLEELRLLLRELEISDCEMQEGSLRCDANVNIQVPLPQVAGAAGPPWFAATPIIEVKNLNSFRAVERAMKYEAERQYGEFRQKFGTDWQLTPPLSPPLQGGNAPVSPPLQGGDAGGVQPVAERRQERLVPVAKATAGWDEFRGVTKVQRRKEEAADYRYFPEPDLVPVVVDAAGLERIRGSLGELPAVQRRRLQEQYQLSAYDAQVLSGQGRAFVAYFEETVRRGALVALAKNWLANDILQALNERRLSIADFPIKAPGLAELLKELQSTGLNKQRAREVFALMLASGSSARQAIDKLGFKAVADAGELREIIKKAIADNPKAVADFKKGKVKAADAIKGAVMRQTKGMAKTEVVQRLLLEELAKV